MKRTVAVAITLPAVAMALQTAPALASQTTTKPAATAHRPPPPDVYTRIYTRAYQELKNTTRNKANNNGRYNCNFYSGYWPDSGDGGCASSSSGVRWRGNEWCADFVWYVWRDAGATKRRPKPGEWSKAAYNKFKQSVAPTFAGSFYRADSSFGTYHAKSYYFTKGRMPVVGSAVMFDWQGSGGGNSGWGIDHVGIVVSANYKNKTITTIEGNSTDQAIRTKTYDMDKSWDRSVIVGYKVPK